MGSITERNSEVDTREVIGVGSRDLQPRPLVTHLLRLCRHPSRVLGFFVRKRGYRQGWDYLGANLESAYAMVDSSRDEAELTRRGRAVAQLLTDALLIEPSHTVLEIGCGPARIGREMAPRCASWVGVDISKRMVQRGQQRMAHLPNVSFVVLQGASLAMFSDASIDRVYCHSVLVHLDPEDMFRYLREVARVLKPGGLAYLDTWNILHPESWRWFAASVEVSPLVGRKESWRPQFSTAAAFRRFIEKAGLAEILLLEDSHLLQAFVTLAPVGEDPIRWVEELRQRIAPFAAKMVGLD